MKNLVLLVFLLTLSACGSTSNLRNAKNPDANIDLGHYDIVIVNDFTDGINKGRKDPKIVGEGKRFADIIASHIMAKSFFTSVTRNTTSSENAILIDGEITQYEEGNPVGRMLIGFGVGSSHFDATVNVRDNISKKILGNIKVDHMSWALGGALAAAQDTNFHITSSAAKIANELVKAKRNIKTQ